MDWSSTAAAGASAVGGLLSNMATGLYNANQARINRQFQREMYERQYQDALKFWDMQNQYNNPSAQLNRIKMAGLNGQLLYGQGGVQNVATGTPQVPSKPSGAQASAAFSNPIEMAQYALIDAQKQKLIAEKDKIESEKSWTDLQAQWDRDSYDVRLAIQRGDLEYVNTKVEELRTKMYNETRITSQQIQTLAQARLYEVKRYNLTEWQLGQQVSQGWTHLSNEKEANRIRWSEVGAMWQHIKNETKMTDWQVGRIAFDIMWDAKTNPLKMQGLTLDNMLKRWETRLKKATLSEKNAAIINQNLRNWYYGRYGSESPFEGKYTKDLISIGNMLDATFIAPMVSGNPY